MKSSMRKIAVLLLILCFGLMFVLERRSARREEQVFPSTDVEMAEEPSAGESAFLPLDAVSDVPEEEAVQAAPEVTVHVCGAVREEGVYVLQEGMRVVDAINRAGGLTEDADGAALNQAAFLKDGTRIYVPFQGESSPAAGGDPYLASGEKEDRIDLNTAGLEELMRLPGIGEMKAKAILSYREKNGAFQTAEDVMKVPGIKEGLYERIRDRVFVGS